MTLLSTIASTSMGAALTAAGSSSAVAIVPNSRTKFYTINITAASVTSGATFNISVKGPNGDYQVTSRFAITADGTYSFPIRPREQPPIDSNVLVKVVCEARTDGSYTPLLSTLTVA